MHAPFKHSINWPHLEDSKYLPSDAPENLGIPKEVFSGEGGNYAGSAVSLEQFERAIGVRIEDDVQPDAVVCR